MDSMRTDSPLSRIRTVVWKPPLRLSGPVARGFKPSAFVSIQKLRMAPPCAAPCGRQRVLLLGALFTCHVSMRGEHAAAGTGGGAGYLALTLGAEMGMRLGVEHGYSSACRVMAPHQHGPPSTA